MSEQAIQSQPEIATSSTVHGGFESLAADHPDIVELANPEVTRSAEQLVEEFGIKEEFFQGEFGGVHTLLLASVASNLARFESEGMDAQRNPAEFEFVADSVMSIALDYVTGFDEVVTEAKSDHDGELSDAHKADILDKYTSKELTDGLNQVIEQDGLLDAVRDRLQVTPETEDPFEVRVLSVSESEDVNHFFANPEWPTTEQWEADPVQARRMSEEAAALQDAADEWRRGLVERRASFLSESGHDSIGPAFVERLNGKTYLCIAGDTAERIIDKAATQERAESYEDREYEGDIAFLEHEYTHTQGRLNLENYTGIALEELRAEHFSGNKQGYTDIKFFAQDVAMITGFNVRARMLELPKGGTPEDIYSEIASEFGLDNLSRLLSVLPDVYAQNHSNQFQRGAMEYVGGREGVVRSLFEQVVSNGSEDAVKQRAAEHAKTISNLGGSDFVMSYRANFSSLGTELIQEQLEAQQHTNNPAAPKT